MLLLRVIPSRQFNEVQESLLFPGDWQIGLRRFRISQVAWVLYFITSYRRQIQWLIIFQRDFSARLYFLCLIVVFLFEPFKLCIMF